MDTNTVTVSVIGSLVTALGILALVLKSFIGDKKPSNGNGTVKLSDIEEMLNSAISGFREAHIENKMRQEDIIKTLSRIEASLITCSDILKTMPKRITD